MSTPVTMVRRPDPEGGHERPGQRVVLEVVPGGLVGTAAVHEAAPGVAPVPDGAASGALGPHLGPPAVLPRAGPQQRPPLRPKLVVHGRPPVLHLRVRGEPAQATTAPTAFTLDSETEMGTARSGAPRTWAGEQGVG